VNSYTTELQNVLSVASDKDGNFVVVWQSWAQDGGATTGSSGSATTLPVRPGGPSSK
jgi:hypothetical protein